MNFYENMTGVGSEAGEMTEEKNCNDGKKHEKMAEILLNFLLSLNKISSFRQKKKLLSSGWGSSKAKILQ